MSSIDRAYLKIANNRYGLRDMADENGNVPDSRKEHFIYGTAEAGSSLAVAAGTVISMPINISQEADFVATKIVQSHVKGNAANTWSVEFITSDTSRQLQNTPIPQDSFFGTAQLPGIFSMPRILWRNTTVQFRITREVVGTVGADLIWIAMWGYKVFYDLANLNLTTRTM
jgi:hypothetical protein